MSYGSLAQNVALSFHVEGCSREAAEYAVANWHYSRKIPVGRTISYSVWEDESFRGVVVFGRGSSPQIGKAFHIRQDRVCELVRVALRSHVTPVSRILAVCVRLLRDGNPNLRLILSFADPRHGHHGGIYQAAGWLYLGESKSTPLVRMHGRLRHHRSVLAACGSWSDLARLRSIDPRAEHVVVPAKHRYALPLDLEMRTMLGPLVQPNPKRAPVV